MATEFLKITNRATSTLDGNIADDALSLDVGAGEGVLFPDEFPFHITIEDEILSCTNRAGDTLTVVRAQQGTVAVAHTSGVDVQLRITAQNISDLNDAVNSIEEHTLVIRKTADETVNNSAVLQNDDHLLVPVAANEVWEIKGLLRVSTNEDADFKYAFAVPVASTIRGYASFEVGQLTVATSAMESRDYTAEVPNLYHVNSSNLWVLVRALYIGGANAGNAQLQWAQNTAQASDTKVLANSYIIARKIT